MSHLSTYYVERRIPIDAKYLDHLSGDLKGGTPMLQVNCYYMKDARVRGIKLSITRVAVERGSVTSAPFEKCNTSMNLLDIPRKNDKKGRAAAAVVLEHLDRIKEVALESDRPDFQTLLNELGPKVRAAAA